MISNICKIEKGTKDLDAILKESERVALYNGFNKKQTLQLRLICEEIDGMLPNIIGNFDGELWIEYENGVCKVTASVNIPDLDINGKEELIKVAKNKKNAAVVGIASKIRNTIENFFLEKWLMGTYSSAVGAFHMSTGYCEGVDYSYLWTLNQYKDTVKDSKQEEWDELEKSIIANLADDVIVGVKGKQAKIVVVKEFK